MRTRVEFSRPGVYVLVGPGEAALPQVYVGEAEELRNRLDSHQQKKDFWTRFVAFTSKDGNINKAHVRYLEARLVALGNVAKRALMTNGNAPVLPALSEADAADVENFLSEMLSIFPVLEVSAFQLSVAPETLAGKRVTTGATESVLQLMGPQTTATGTDAPEGFIVKAGSRGRLKEVPSMHEWLHNIRKSLIGQGILAQDGEQLVVTQDYPFDSPSIAAGVLLGRAANRRVEWRNAGGKTLKLVREGYVSLVGDIWLATTRLNLRTPRQWGALKGSTSLKVGIGRWPAQQVLAGQCTWLDLDLLRALGTGLPARMWVALEAWARWPQRSLDGREETTIGLGQPALESLGVGRYNQLRQARAALNRAGQAMIAVDPAYEFASCERRGGGWCLVIRRVSGARARADARKAGRHRDPGIAAKKQRREAEQDERRAVRQIIRRGLDETPQDGVAEHAA